ncbi:hypothetical protein BMW23_0178 [Bodo saltans virus]|uniref:Uncharacterized protein n=1 Tax=Bodo saltans virus TaxID=2024608 RepID=A0A2H4UTQ9_9VIRU|nr:hypothetical protein QJ851_gp0173 [Bodo saltans virus]ATZ80236.1 hypothetical protein BMW23_0178 [Bodo saltans virus]
MSTCNYSHNLISIEIKPFTPQRCKYCNFVVYEEQNWLNEHYGHGGLCQQNFINSGAELTAKEEQTNMEIFEELCIQEYIDIDDNNKNEDEFDIMELHEIDDLYSPYE